MTIETKEEFQEQCALAMSSLTILADYTDGGDAELDADDAMWLLMVISAFNMMVGGDDSDDDSDFRVDDTLY